MSSCSAGSSRCRRRADGTAVPYRHGHRRLREIHRRGGVGRPSGLAVPGGRRAAPGGADRLPWLHAIAAHIGQWRDAGGHGVVTCSALRRSYRDILRAGPGDVHFVYLKAERALIVERFSARRGHFMPASLIDSQIATLQEPAPDEPVLTLSVTQKLPLLVAAAADLALIH
jgi:carbohydrate kinase (thermoresistant glucokinase family)